MLYMPRNRSMTRYFSFTSFQLRAENFAPIPLSSAVRQFVVPQRFFIDRIRTERIAVGNQARFPVFAFHQPLLVVYSTHNFGQLPRLSLLPLFVGIPLHRVLLLCIFSGHEKTSCRSLIFFDRRSFRHCQFFRGFTI